MSRIYYNGKSARRRLRCSRDCFLFLINTGLLTPKRTSIGGYRLLKSQVDSLDLVDHFFKESRALASQCEMLQSTLEKIHQLAIQGRKIDENVDCCSIQ